MANDGTKGAGGYIHAFSVTLTVTCKCGSLKPIMVVFIPGIPLKAWCDECRTEFRLGKLIYDASVDSGSLTVGLSAEKPLIELAKGPIPV